MIVILDSIARKQYATAQLSKVPVDACMEMEIRIRRRSSQQNRRHWAMMNTIADQMPSQREGEWVAPEIFHEYFKRRYLGVILIDEHGNVTDSTSTVIDGRTIVIPHPSKTLDKVSFNKWDQMIDCWMAENDIIMDGNF